MEPRRRSGGTGYGAEPYVFVQQNQEIHPLEIKKSANPDKREVKKYALLDRAALKRGCGGIVCMCEQVTPIDAQNCFIPCHVL